MAMIDYISLLNLKIENLKNEKMIEWSCRVVVLIPK